MQSAAQVEVQRLNAVLQDCYSKLTIVSKLGSTQRVQNAAYEYESDEFAEAANTLHHLAQMEETVAVLHHSDDVDDDASEISANYADRSRSARFLSHLRELVRDTIRVCATNPQIYEYFVHKYDDAESIVSQFEDTASVDEAVAEPASEVKPASMESFITDIGSLIQYVLQRVSLSNSESSGYDVHSQIGAAQVRVAMLEQDLMKRTKVFEETRNDQRKELTAIEAIAQATSARLQEQQQEVNRTDELFWKQINDMHDNLEHRREQFTSSSQAELQRLTQEATQQAAANAAKEKELRKRVNRLRDELAAMISSYDKQLMEKDRRLLELQELHRKERQRLMQLQDLFNKVRLYRSSCHSGLIVPRLTRNAQEQLKRMPSLAFRNKLAA